MSAYAFCDGDHNVLDLAFACFDKNPVNQWHLLILARRHVATWFYSSAEETAALFSLLDEGKRLLGERFAPDGYNIGTNVGDATGQTVMRLYIHLIRRDRGDCANPRGGHAGCDSFPAFLSAGERRRSMLRRPSRPSSGRAS